MQFNTNKPPSKIITNTLYTSYAHITKIQDEQLHEIVKTLHPIIGASLTVKSEQIHDIHWATVAESLKDSKVGDGIINRNSKIASYVRKPAECMRRYSKLRGASASGASNKGPWTKEEDKKVIELVAKQGPKRWSQIASELPGQLFIFYFYLLQCAQFLLICSHLYLLSPTHIPLGRIGKQCRERWHNHLNPSISKAPWTKEEDRVILRSQIENTTVSWADIAKQLPGMCCFFFDMVGI